jgi:XTP/dITP diphosphohydrolase
MNKIVIATTNKHKFNEIRDILSPIVENIEFLSLNGYEINPPKEDGKTFFENALIKARYYYSKLRIPVLSDDSGLEVEALGGRPGVLSARYAGENSTQRDLINKLLKEMEGVTNRKARFVCVAIFMYGDEKFIFSQGVLWGNISHEPRGDKGFGYDPVFIPDGYTRTLAELGEEVKNKISHRYNAFFELALKMKELGIF